MARDYSADDQKYAAYKTAIDASDNATATYTQLQAQADAAVQTANNAKDAMNQAADGVKTALSDLVEALTTTANSPAPSVDAT